MGPVKEGTGLKTITLTRQRLVQSQLNPAHYTTGGAMLRALRNSADEDNDYPAANGLDVHLVILCRLLNGLPGGGRPWVCFVMAYRCRPQVWAPAGTSGHIGAWEAETGRVTHRMRWSAGFRILANESTPPSVGWVVDCAICALQQTANRASLCYLTTR